jgi:FAD:protein FMN transferase
VVDLGGIAKGYTGDEAIKIYKRNNIKSAYINLGGNVVVLGNRPDGSPWRIGIQNPRAANGLYIGVVKVTGKAVVTSGDYERYFERNNVRYHHILDTKTGYPADSGLISATIITDVSMDADALSTATFVLGLEKGMKLVNSLKGVEAVFITKDKKVYVTEGLKSSFTFDDESKEFKYVEKG